MKRGQLKYMNASMLYPSFELHNCLTSSFFSTPFLQFRRCSAKPPLTLTAGPSSIASVGWWALAHICQVNYKVDSKEHFSGCRVGFTVKKASCSAMRTGVLMLSIMLGCSQRLVPPAQRDPASSSGLYKHPPTYITHVHTLAQTYTWVTKIKMKKKNL